MTATGDILPCTCFNNPIGNIFSDEPIKIKASIDSFVKNVNDVSTRCVNCKYINICHGGCPGYSMKFWGVLNGGDPRCPLIQKKNE